MNTVNQLNDDRNITSSYDKVSLARNIYKWHEILGHCNFDDIMKQENVVSGMKVVVKVHVFKSTFTEGMFANCRNRAPDNRAIKPLEKVHTDLAGPIFPVSKNGFKYRIAFTDNFPGAIFAFFLRNKTDALLAIENC